MQVSQAVLVALFVSMGYKTATRWKLEQLTTKVNKIHSLADDDAAELSQEQEKLLKKLKKAAQAGTEIKVISEEVAEEASEKPSKKGKTPAAKPKKAAEPEEEEDEDDAESPDEEGDEEDEDEERPTKGKKSGTGVKEKKTGRPPSGTGVIAEITTMLKKASAKKPVTKEQIHEHLIEKFPDRSPDSMMSTINIQVPNRLKREKGLNIVKNDKGYYVQASDE